MDFRDIAIWGGVECTVNRLHNEYYDQLSLSGHDRRLSDFDELAELGLKTLRVPILWERVAPETLDEANWDWSDKMMRKLHDLQITPIVGLIHHGSGPRHTSLLHENFPNIFAKYASAVAKRYPEVKFFTPINEPLTTARFSCLYGHWYPHSKETRDFLTALINQCYATALAMKAIRKIIPEAQLVQTEDLGRTFATTHLENQMNFENDRRWLTFDLLGGRVDSHHPLWNFILDHGIEAESLFYLQESAVPPDILGINHYVTSNRFLDHRVHLYPSYVQGSNQVVDYADVEAIRVEGTPEFILDDLLTEAWMRYQIPIAITEAHLGCCTPEEQGAWFEEVLRAAILCKGRGVEILAVTAWALFGSYDWDSLLTDRRGRYESGIFDVSSGKLEHTINTKPLEQLIKEERLPLKTSYIGWWRKSSRVLYQQEDFFEVNIPPFERNANFSFRGSPT